MEKRAKRKLSAILSADVKDYSRLMGEDELGTVRTLEAYREMIAEFISNYSSRFHCLETAGYLFSKREAKKVIELSRTLPSRQPQYC